MTGNFNVDDNVAVFEGEGLPLCMCWLSENSQKYNEDSCAFDNVSPSSQSSFLYRRIKITWYWSCWFLSLLKCGHGLILYLLLKKKHFCQLLWHVINSLCISIKQKMLYQKGVGAGY